MRDADVPGAVTEAFRVLERTPLPPREGAIWAVGVIRTAEYPVAGHVTTYWVPGTAPPPDVLAAMEDTAGWPALMHSTDDLSKDRPEPNRS